MLHTPYFSTLYRKIVSCVLSTLNFLIFAVNLPRYENKRKFESAHLQGLSMDDPFQLFFIASLWDLLLEDDNESITGIVCFFSKENIN